MKAYAGIGSRETPSDVLNLMRELAKKFAGKMILRSGSAPGADKAFEEGCDKSGGNKEIYIPWEGFENRYPNNKNIFLYKKEALEIAKKYHPAWYKLSLGAKYLMARNVHQILGRNLDDPVKFVICWTKDGKASGGTGQAIRIAKDMDIKVFNLKNNRKNNL